MIGYYVHHHGRGHLHRAFAVGRALGEPMTILTSMPRPAGHPGEWVHLERDDRAAAPLDPTARDRLHWVPSGDPGLSRRMHQISDWLESARPRLTVVDVSVEVTLLARLHGVPVVGVVLPGRRGDQAHRLGFDVADTLVAAWPPCTTARMLPDLAPEVRSRVRAVGAISRFPAAASVERRPGPPRVVVLGGTGGSDLTGEVLDDAVRSAPGWEWAVCGPPGPWSDDPHALLRDADVVVTHAGQNALAEVAAARHPAVVVPQARPYDEQVVTAAALRDGGWPALVEDVFPRTGWAERLDRAAALDGDHWTFWCDGRATHRFADVLAAAGSGTLVA